MSILKKEFKSRKTVEGGGIIVNRVFGYGQTRDFDPFLMLDYFEEEGGKESPGVPWHPHKGIETITYFVKGSGQHEDSLGNKGIITEGELQWMTAGRGIMHQEMPGDINQPVQGFQFWVNMKAKDKLNPPSYQYIKKGTMKKHKEDGITVNVISGMYKDIEGPIDKKEQGITMIHVIMEKGSEIEIQREEGKNGYMFIFKGEGTLDKNRLNYLSAYTLSPGKVVFKATKDTEFIYAEGTPLNEPIEWYGPIVMNTKEQIRETLEDLNNGTFIKEN